MRRRATEFRHETKRGFTLIEVLVVIVLMSLVLGLGGGLYAGSYQRMLLEKAAKDIFLMARYARVAAIESQKPFQLMFDRANQRFWVVTTEQDETTLETSQTVVSNSFCRPQTLPDSVTFEKIGIVSLSQTDEDVTVESFVTFLPDGTADTAAIQVGNGQTHYTVGIAASTGKVTLISGTTDEIQKWTIDLDNPES